MTYNFGVSFRFTVEIDGLIVGGFSEVSGLEVETEYEEYREGGVNNFVHRLPKQTKYQPILLKRGITTSSTLWDWYNGVVNGQVSRRNGTIVMSDAGGQEICRWNFFRAYPVKWTGPNLNALSSETAVEALEFVHNGFQAVFQKS